VLAEVADASERGAHLERAVAEAERSRRPLVRAAALGALGRHLRLAGDPDGARARLEAALALVDATGAAGRRPGLHAELHALGVEPAVAVGARPPAPDPRRAAPRAAGGRGPHRPRHRPGPLPHPVGGRGELGAALRKLGVSSRHALASALAP
jgi:hypothetical protein